MPPRHNPDSLTFINQTSWSSRTPGKQLSAIRSHTGKYQYRKAKLGDQGELVLVAENRLSVESEANQNPTEGQPDDYDVDEEIQITHARHSRKAASQALLPLNGISGSCVDPFSRVPVIWNHETLMLLRYFQGFAILGASNEPSELLSMRQNRPHYKQGIDDAMGNFFSHERHMLTMLAMASARLNVFSPGTLAPTRSAYYSASALKYLQHLEEEDLSWRTLYDVGCMAATALYLNDQNLVRTHLNGFNRILPLVKTSASHEHVMHFVLGLDVTFAMSTGRKPMLTWPDNLEQQCHPRSEIISPDVDQDLETADYFGLLKKDLTLVKSDSEDFKFAMGMELLLLDQRLSLSKGIHEVLGEVARCGYLARFVFHSSQAMHEDAHAMCMSLLRLHHSLLSHRFDGIAEALRMCLFLNLTYLRTRLSFGSENTTAKKLAKILEPIIDDINSYGEEVSGLMVWMCVVGASAATAPDLKDWYMIRSLQAVRAVQLTKPENIQAHVDKYFFLEALHRTTVAEIESRLRRSSGARSATVSPQLSPSLPELRALR